MVSVTRNVRAIQIAVEDAARQAILGRNQVVRDYHNKLPASVKDGLVYSHGSASFQNRTLNQFFEAIKKRPLTLPIRFTGGDPNNILAAAANDISNKVFQRAHPYIDTGTHLKNIHMFVREIGSPLMSKVQGRVQGHTLPRRAVISIVAMTEYASTLEYRGVWGSILYHAAWYAKEKWGDQVNIRYDYVSGKKFGAAGGTFPRIQIGFEGNIRRRKATIQRPGITARRKRRGYAQVKGRSR